MVGNTKANWIEILPSGAYHLDRESKHFLALQKMVSSAEEMNPWELSEVSNAPVLWWGINKDVGGDTPWLTHLLKCFQRNRKILTVWGWDFLGSKTGAKEAQETQRVFTGSTEQFRVMEHR